jgi:hypothetical protein
MVVITARAGDVWVAVAPRHAELGEDGGLAALDRLTELAGGNVALTGHGARPSDWRRARAPPMEPAVAGFPGRVLYRREGPA